MTNLDQKLTDFDIQNQKLTYFWNLDLKNAENFQNKVIFF